MDTCDENLVIICWFYVENCTFVHITDKIFPVTSPSSETPGPQSRGDRTASASNYSYPDSVCQILLEMLRIIEDTDDCKLVLEMYFLK